VPEAGFVAQSCYVVPTASSVSAMCAPAGPEPVDGACRNSTDCNVLLACVQVDGTNRCETFSCGLHPSCSPGTYYAVKPLVVDGVARTATSVPVCLPNLPCMLLQSPSVCVAGKVCAVVGSQGETSCVTPGSAKQNEWCDEANACAEGLVCAIRPDRSQDKCLKLCHIEQGATECPGGTCQGGNKAIPDGFGICVGDSADGG
jgi:hypothetical protein